MHHSTTVVRNENMFFSLTVGCRLNFSSRPKHDNLTSVRFCYINNAFRQRHWNPGRLWHISQHGCFDEDSSRVILSSEYNNRKWRTRIFRRRTHRSNQVRFFFFYGEKNPWARKCVASLIVYNYRTNCAITSWQLSSFDPRKFIFLILRNYFANITKLNKVRGPGIRKAHILEDLALGFLP